MIKLTVTLALILSGAAAQADTRSVIGDWIAETSQTLHTSSVRIWGGKIQRELLPVMRNIRLGFEWEEQDLLLTITVQRDGTVVDVEGKDRDDNPRLEIIRDTIMAASPLPAAPDYMPNETYKFALPVRIR